MWRPFASCVPNGAILQEVGSRPRAEGCFSRALVAGRSARLRAARKSHVRAVRPDGAAIGSPQTPARESPQLYECVRSAGFDPCGNARDSAAGRSFAPCEGPQLAPGSLHALRQLRPEPCLFGSAAAAHPAIRPRGRSAALFLKIGSKRPVIRLKTGKTRAVRSKFRFSDLQVSDFLYIYSRVMQKVQP